VRHLCGYARCRATADNEGLHPRLYQQAMHNLELPRFYRTIFICDSFGLGGHREQDVEALRRCYGQLETGAVLVLSHYLAYHNPERWPYWLPGQRQCLPESWPETGTRNRAADGDEIELRVRVVDINPVTQCETQQIRAALWREGSLVAEEEHTLRENVYFCQQLEWLLANAGFNGIEVRKGYSEEAAMSWDSMVVFVARKQRSRPNAGQSFDKIQPRSSRI
jgi:hypothetical protein